MTADVNVTEKAREAALARWALGSSDTTQMLMAVDAALSVLSDPVVLAGMAEVLVHEIYPAHDPDECCDEWQRDHAERVATALADWLRGHR